MELDNLITQDLAEEGVWEPIVLYGKPANFDLKILGTDSDVVQKFVKQSMKKLRKLVNQPSDNDEFNDDEVQELTDADDEAVLIRIADIRGWKVTKSGLGKVERAPEPVTIKGIELKNDRKSFKLLIQNIPEIKKIVLATSNKRVNFLADRKKN
jgi:hypothetical protein